MAGLRKLRVSLVSKIRHESVPKAVEKELLEPLELARGVSDYVVCLDWETVRDDATSRGRCCFD